jgi:hypothetical protein
MTCKKPYSSPVILSVLMRNEISIEIDHVDRDWDDIDQSILEWSVVAG